MSFRDIERELSGRESGPEDVAADPLLAEAQRLAAVRRVLTVMRSPDLFELNIVSLIGCGERQGEFELRLDLSGLSDRVKEAVWSAVGEAAVEAHMAALTAIKTATDAAIHDEMLAGGSEGDASKEGQG